MCVCECGGAGGGGVMKFKDLLMSWGYVLMSTV